MAFTWANTINFTTLDNQGKHALNIIKRVFITKDSNIRNNVRDLQQELSKSLEQHAGKPAFFSQGVCFSYQHLQESVSGLQNLFLSNRDDLKSIGIIANSDFATYASIIASLLSGITFIPIEPSHPDERNNHIIEISELDFIYCSDITTLNKSFYERNRLKFLPVSPGTDNAKKPFVLVTNMAAYILFTSGTTGLPKGVPITLENLEAFAHNIEMMGVKVTDEDRFLQVIDLTFDLSIFLYLIPLLHGACVYILPKARLKYLPALQLIEEKGITHITTVPSFTRYLEPYLKEISLPSLKYWLFSGEALKTRNVEGWRKCIPTAKIFNVYGPTEATVFCSSYRCNVHAIKDRKGIVCIGKPFEGTSFKLFSDGNCITGYGTSGELCIAGLQLTKGYLGNDLKNKEAFFQFNGLTYYKTGDICSVDSDGDYFFEGRNDSQIKIDGYRIELGEIENITLAIKGIKNAVAIAVTERNSVQIILFVVGDAGLEEEVIRSYLKQKIPDYMIPRKLIFIGDVPLNLNGKIDKKSLLAIYEQKD